MMKNKTCVYILSAMIVLASFAPRPAHAICEINAEVTASQGNAITRQAAEISTIIANLQAQISAVIPVELTDLVSKITGFSSSLRTGMADMWVDWEDAMQNQTAQEHTAIIDYSRNILTAEDAMQFNEAEQAQALNEVKARTDAEPNENSCTFDTVMQLGPERNAIPVIISNTMSSSFSDEMASGTPNITPEYLAAIGIDGDDGQDTEIAGIFNSANAQSRAGLSKGALNKLDYERYMNLFCNRYENGGRSPCGTDGSRVDDDIEISRTLFGRDTLLLSTTDRDSASEDMVVLKATVDNLTGRPRSTIFPPSALKSASGIEAYLEKRSSIAHFNVANGLVWDIIGERFPSQTETEVVKELRIASGVPENDTSTTPGKYEFRQAYIEHVNSPPYIFSLTGTPQKLAENELHLKAVKLMMMNDLNAKMEKLATLFSVQLSNQLMEKEQD